MTEKEWRMLSVELYKESQQGGADNACDVLIRLSYVAATMANRSKE